jgi:hypothetical protein
MSNLGGLDEDMVQENQEDKVVDITASRPKRRPFHYWTVGERDYKLKLTTSMIEKLENKYRTNIVNLVGGDGIPPLSVMLTIIQAAMAPWEHKVSYQDVKKMYDTWSENGGNQMEFFTGVLMPTLAVSGFFTDKQAESMLESMKDMDDLL